MTGQEVYEVWSERMLDNGVEVDSWEQIDENDQDAWGAVGDLVAE